MRQVSAIRKAIGGAVVAALLLSAPAQAFSLFGKGESPAPLPETYIPAQKPLVIIRFNQSRVYYERPLYNAVLKALQVKPDVTFDLLALSPSTGVERSDAEFSRLAWYNAQAVHAAMLEMGVPQNRIHLIPKASRAVPTTEVHIFVR